MSAALTQASSAGADTTAEDEAAMGTAFAFLENESMGDRVLGRVPGDREAGLLKDASGEVTTEACRSRDTSLSLT